MIHDHIIWSKSSLTSVTCTNKETVAYEEEDAMTTRLQTQ